MKNDTQKGLDKLYDIFERHLYSGLVEEERPETLIECIIEEYINHLLSQGYIPTGALSTLKADLKDEVTEMYRKKTYGHNNLMEFRLTRSTKIKKTVGK